MTIMRGNGGLLRSRTGLYLSAFLLGGAAVGALAAMRLWTKLGSIELFLVAALFSTLLGVAATALMLPRAMTWAHERGVRLPRASPITLHGLAFVALILLVGGAALYSGNNLVYLILSAMLAMTLLSGLVSRLDLAGLQLTLRLPDHVFAGRSTWAQLGLRNLKSWTPAFAIRVQASNPSDAFQLQSVYFPLISPKEHAAASTEALFARRGRYGGAGVDLITRFPFGLVERRAKLELRDRIVAYPSVEMTPDAKRALQRLMRTALSRLSGDSHDLYRIRPAVDGDGARFIHWKASAGAGGLWVREFTQEARLTVRLVLDRRTPADPASRERFEELVSGCAAAAWALASEGADVTLVTDERSIACRAGERIYDLLGYLALVESAPEDGPAPPPRIEREAEYEFTIQRAEAALRPS